MNEETTKTINIKEKEQEEDPNLQQLPTPQELPKPLQLPKPQQLPTPQKESEESEKSEEPQEQIFDLQLGDIIQLNAPSNMDLHDKQFYIKFINKNKIELLNSEKTITLEISDEGNFLEESIENIIILYRNPSPSYIVQNNLTLNSNISIYFGEPLPKVLNGKITNIEEDMMEITLFPNKDIIYIDFGYSGIPENLNIEKIVIRDSAADEIEFKEENKEVLEDNEAIYLNIDNKDALDNDLLFNVYAEKIDENLNDSIDFDEDEEFEDIQNVYVSEDEKRYSLEEQINDYIDSRMDEIKKEELNNIVKNKINLEALRFNELRNFFSDFDENNNANKRELKNEYFKPLKEVLINLNKKLYWLLPVINNKKILFGKNMEDDEESSNDDIVIMNNGEFLEKFIEIADKWSEKSSIKNIQNYKKFISDLNSICETTIYNYEQNNINLEVNTNNINVINDLYNNFYSYVVKNTEINEERFVIDVFNSGLSMFEFDSTNKKKLKTKILTTNDKITCIAFLTLPLPIFNFSKINMEYTSLYEKCNLSHNFFNYSRILNSFTNVNNFSVDDNNKTNFLESHINIHNDTIFDNINSFNIGDLNSDSYEEKFEMLLESFIPTKMKIIAKIFEKYKINNFSELINVIQCANIDIHNLHNNDYKLIQSLFDKNLKFFKSEYMNNRDLIKKILYSYDYKDNVKKDNYYGFNLLNKEIKADVFEYYEIKENYEYNSIEELYNRFLKIDNAKFFMNALNKNIMDLIVSNLLENFIKQSKDLSVNKEKSQDQGQGQGQGQNEDEDNCDKYFLSKKYNSLQELESDNNKLTYFDSIYDKTFYSIINDFENERNTMSTKEFFEFLTLKIMEVMNFTKKNALREAKAIMEEKKEIIDGDYAVLIDNESKKNYIYVRKNNIWELDEKFKDAFYIDSNKIFCDSSKDCISDGENCLSGDKISKNSIKKDVDKVLENFEFKYNLSIEEIKGKVNDSYELSKKYIKKMKLLNQNNSEKINKLYLEYDNELDLNVVRSPQEELRDYVLSIQDFPKKQEYIRLFCLKFTRNAINEEEPNWLYCIKTHTKLIPKFLLKLANAYISSNNYQIILDTICAEQGTISDDNNYWVDKYSGYIIKRIDFSSDEGYDEQGFKLNTKEIIEGDYVMDVNNSKLFNTDINTISMLLKSITQQIGINISNHYEMIINNIIKIQNSNVVSKEQYEKMVKANNKKTDKSKALPPYEDVYNLSLLLLTLVFILVTIQINIPSIKTKKTFPGCIKSFRGYPFDETEDKTAIIYIACVASKMKSSIKPWNTILKMSESTIVKKMDALIEKNILLNPTIIDLMQKKRDYLNANKEVEDLEKEYALENWNSFMPPIMQLNIDPKSLEPIGSGFKDELLENITKGKKNNYIDIIESKIIYLSNAIIESIQKIVAKEAILLESKSGEPYLENACCNNVNNAINYFASKDNTIYENNKLIKNYSDLINKLKDLKNPKILYDNTNTNLEIAKIELDFSEEIIYKAFIYYCNFENNIPIDDELKSVCMNKPSNYDTNIHIKEKIELLKGEGKIYGKSNLDELLEIINKRNFKFLDNDQNIINNVEKIRLIIENYESFEERYILDEQLLNKIKELVENYGYDSNKDNLKNLKNYFLTVNAIMKENILEFAKLTPNFSKKDYENLVDLFKFDIDKNNYLFFKEYIRNFLITFPNIIINKNVNYLNPPKHWQLSDLHNNDVFNIMKKYYEKINLLSMQEEFSILYNIVNNKCKILLELINYFIYYESNYFSEEILINSIFDEEIIKYFLIYCFTSIFYEYINIIDSDEFNMEVLDNESYDKNIFKLNVFTFLIESFGIMNNHNKLLNSNYKKVKEKVLISKEKEKDLITDYLRNLTDEERELENLFKNNKLEKWSKGLQKGITQYVQKNYDEERDAMEKQALKEKMLNKKNEVTDMNKEIYMMDLEEEMANEAQIDEEAYDMAAIPDDDDVDSDYEYDY